LYVYTVSQKNMPPNFCLYLHQILTDFKNSVTGTLCGKFAVTQLVNIPPHLYRCGGIRNNHFIANFPQSVPVKEFLKSVIFGEDVDHSMVACLFLTHGVQ